MGQRSHVVLCGGMMEEHQNALLCVSQVNRENNMSLKEKFKTSLYKTSSPPNNYKIGGFRDQCLSGARDTR